MVKTKLVEKIKDILCRINKDNHKYATAWLSYSDDLTGRERYVLNVQVAPHIESRFDELRYISTRLREELNVEDYRLISRVDVHNDGGDASYPTDAIVVFEKDVIYSA